MPDHDEPMEMRVRRDPTAHINPTPKPATAEQVLLGLIRENKAETADVSRHLGAAMDQVENLDAEAKRLEAIREGLEAALKAIRYPKASAPTQ